MKKLLIFTVCAVFLAPKLTNAQVSYTDEAKELGSISGQGMACKATKSKTFDMLARAILLSKAPDANSRDSALKTFLESKANAYILAQDNASSDCGDVLSRFDKQQIFNIKLYQDGTITFPDGSIVTPKIPYDASAI